MSGFARATAMAACVAAVLGGCATKGALRKASTDQMAALQAERAERMSADGKLATDLSQLRTDLGTLRTEFGAKIAAVQDGMKFDLPVHFGFDQSDVRPEDTAALDKFGQVVSKYYSGAVVTVEGFADPAGTVRYNNALSLHRADAVRSYLVGKQVQAQIRSVGYGKTRLVTPGASKDQPGAELNRRVVFVVESPSASASVAALDH